MIQTKEQFRAEFLKLVTSVSNFWNGVCALWTFWDLQGSGRIWRKRFVYIVHGNGNLEVARKEECQSRDGFRVKHLLVVFYLKNIMFEHGWIKWSLNKLPAYLFLFKFGPGLVSSIFISTSEVLKFDGLFIDPKRVFCSFCLRSVSGLNRKCLKCNRLFDSLWKVRYYNQLTIKLRTIEWENTYLIIALTDFCRWFGSLLHGVSTLCNRRNLVLLRFVTGTSVPFCFGWSLSSTVPNINCCIKLSRIYPSSKFRGRHEMDHSEYSDRTWADRAFLPSSFRSVPNWRGKDWITKMWWIVYVNLSSDPHPK